MVIICFVAALFFLCSPSGAESKDVSNGFSSTHSKYTVVYPHLLHRWKRSANGSFDSTESNEMETISYELEINNRKNLLLLKQNRDFISKRFVQYSHHSGGYSKSTRTNHVHCYYHGHVDGYEDSLVLLSTCSGLRGVIVLLNESFGLEPVPHSTSNEHHLYPLEDVASGDGVCGVANETPAQGRPSPFDPGHTLTSLLRRRRNLPDTRFVELVLVVDNLRYRIKQSNETAVTEEMVEMANLLDGYYKQLNVRVALVGLEIFKEENPFNVELSAPEVLNGFVHWRKTDLLPRLQHDVAQLIVGLPGVYEGGVLGMAFVGSVCKAASAGGINVFQSTSTLPYISTVVAHELGHNLGMKHDNKRGCPCGSSCIMAETAGGSTNFSTCSADDFEALVRNGGGQCLKNPPTHSVGLSQCGNGLLEDEEQCDCGRPEECNNRCCDAATCRFSAGSSCADGLCCNNCQVRVAGTPCRDSVNACDLPEYCRGNSGFCPEDFYVMDGLSCEDASAYCYEGRCQTYDSQCRILFEPEARKAADECYSHANVRGDKFGNCGYARGQPIKCSTDNVMCGKVQCTNVDANKPPLGGSLSNTMVGEFKCVNADFSLGTDVVDPAYVNPGSPCSPGKACMDFKCVNATSLLPNLNCGAQTTCNGNGVCNNLGDCHCDKGWGPPSCDRSGSGGSVKSGPAAIDYSLRDGLLIFFLLVVPVLVLVTLLLLYNFQRGSLTACMKATKPGSNNNNDNRPTNARGNDQTNISIPASTVAQPRGQTPADVPPEHTAIPATPGFRFGELNYWKDGVDTAASVPQSVPPPRPPPPQGPGVPRPVPQQGPGVPRPIRPQQPPN
ncbi:unnamed protein product [Boreogadus saida]